jgi:hypothetical protein
MPLATQSQRAVVARAHRAAKRDPSRADDLATAQRDYAALKLEDCIRKIVESAPPLTPEQRDRLAVLLRGA